MKSRESLSSRDHNHQETIKRHNLSIGDSSELCKLGAPFKMAGEQQQQQQQQQQGRVHHRDLGLDDNRDDKISYSAIVNKSIMNKLARPKTSPASTFMTTATKSQQHSSSTSNNNNNNNSFEDRQFSQTMYRMTSMQFHSSRRYNNNNNNPHFFPRRHSSSATKTSDCKLIAPSLMALILASLLMFTSAQVQAHYAGDEPSSSSSSSPSSPSSSSSAAAAATSNAATGLAALASSIANHKDESKSADSGSRRDSSDSLSIASSEKSSIVASISSAVASAAAAAAVAAAQSSLTGSDARSLLSSSSGTSGSSGHRNAGAHHHQRSPGLNFALKLADTIPEVPYNILHNMKKLDHAAPFYNVPGRLSTSYGSGKESGLVSALMSRGAFGGAADHLNTFFRSPLWKRIADGYGDFASEFRSLFRARPTTMKGPASPTTKLLRDISVPAALMLLASAVPSEWRPNMKSRRKSLVETLMPAGLASAGAGLTDPMAMSASEVPNFSIAPQLFGQAQSTPSANNGGSSSSESFMAPNSRAFIGRIDQQAAPAAGQQVARDSQGYINLSPPAQQLQQPIQSESVGGINWLPPSSQAMLAVGQQQQLYGQLENQQQSAALEQQLQQLQQLQQQQQQQQQQPLKRVGESIIAMPSVSPAAPFKQTEPPSGVGFQQTNLKPVNSDHAASVVGSMSMQPPAEARSLPMNGGGGPISSLTSGFAKLVPPFTRLVSGITKANSHAIENPHYRMMALPNSDRERGAAAAAGGSSFSLLSPFRKDQLLSDKHRYSLVDSEESDTLAANLAQTNGGNTNGQQKLSPSSSKSFSLSSALSKAMAILSANESGSLAGSSSSGLTNAAMNASPAGSVQNHRSEQQHATAGSMMLIGDKTINQRETPALLRREMAATGQQPALGQEQRDLTQLLPQSWREAVKRTVSSVKQEASTQWRSIEGQVSNWVQDKLKILPMSASQPALVASASQSAVAAAAAPPAVAKVIASVSSTAMNILGLAPKTANGQPAKGSNNSDLTVASSEQSSSSSSSPSTVKNESPNKSSQSPKGGALAGVANLIVNTLTNRQASNPSSQKPAANADEPGSPSSSSSSSAIISQYPTLTGAQPSSSSSSSGGSQSATSGTPT